MRFLEHILINPTTVLKKGEEYPFIEMSDVSTVNRFPDHINIKQYSSGTKFQHGDTIIARIEPCLQNGKKFYCKNIPLGFGSTEFLVFRPKDENVDSTFLYYFMQKSEIRDLMIKSMKGSTGRQRVNNSIFDKLEIELPNINIQHKIADILSAYDDLIENNTRQINLLEEAAQRLYKEWFVDLHFPGYENCKIVDGVPEGWRVQTASECTKLLRRGISPKYNENGKFKVISQKCIRQTEMNIHESRREEKEYAPDLNILDEDTIICSTGTGTLGRVGQVFGDFPNTTFDSHVTCLRAAEKIGNNYLFWTLKELEPYLKGLGRGSTNQQELYKNVIEDLRILVPSEHTMNEFEDKAKNIHGLIVKIIDCNEELTEARDRLLPKLMSGEIEV